MVLEVIYVVRHGYRLNWSVDPATGTYYANHPTPTGIASDPQLASYGVEQAKQLAAHVDTLEPSPDVVYSSPFYRCLQTIEPSVAKLHATGKTDGKVRVENGVSEFYGTARFTHPTPATLDVLHTHFPFLHTTHASAIRPNPTGETIDGLHNRNAYALHRIITALDVDPANPRALLLCTHAASMICIGRALTGDMPADPNTDDFRCGTCSMSKFVRRRPVLENPTEDIAEWDANRPGDVPLVDWRSGRGVMGGWNCVLNGDCSFLENGEERSWHFSGDESFLDIPLRENRDVKL